MRRGVLHQPEQPGAECADQGPLSGQVNDLVLSGNGWRRILIFRQ